VRRSPGSISRCSPGGGSVGGRGDRTARWSRRSGGWSSGSGGGYRGVGSVRTELTGMFDPDARPGRYGVCPRNYVSQPAPPPSLPPRPAPPADIPCRRSKIHFTWTGQPAEQHVRPVQVAARGASSAWLASRSERSDRMLSSKAGTFGVRHLMWLTLLAIQRQRSSIDRRSHPCLYLARSSQPRLDLNLHLDRTQQQQSLSPQHCRGQDHST